jgi:tetratricopeptide (TPR) repeat protein
LEASGSIGDARNGLKDFIKLHPRSGRVLLATGRLSEQLDEREIAKSYYQKALAAFKEAGDRSRLPAIEQRIERLRRERISTSVTPVPPATNVTPAVPTQVSLSQFSQLNHRCLHCLSQHQSLDPENYPKNSSHFHLLRVRG